MDATHHIISMERSFTQNSQSPMWRCQTEDGERVNIFAHKDPFKNTFRHFQDAGYSGHMLSMEVGQGLKWTNYPIGVIMRKDGKWWNVLSVLPRPEEATPDPAYTPNLALFKAMAAEWANLMISGRYPVVCLDSETTGMRDDDEIVQLAIVDFSHSGSGVYLNTLLRPTNPERMLAASWGDGTTPAMKTGITPEKLAVAPTFVDLWPTIHHGLHGKLWIIYNADFDVRLLRQTCLRYDLRPLVPAGVHCAMKMFAAWYGEWQPAYQDFASKKLEFACEQLGIPVGRSHDALADTLMLAEVIRKMAE